MTLYRYELRKGRLSWIIWTAAMTFVLALCVLIYPMMEEQMAELSQSLAAMGGLSEAMGLDEGLFTDFTSYFAMECSETLGLGGAILASILGASALSKEEREHTAEFLLTHPISRAYVVTSKLLSIYTRLLALNLTVALGTALCIALLAIEADFGLLALVFLSNLLLQIEIASLCFFLSATLTRGGLGVGLGLSLGFYVLNLLSSITEQTEFLQYLTPFAYANGGEIVADGALHAGYLTIGLVLTVAAVAATYWCYGKKDIA